VKSKNPIVISILVGLAIIAVVAAYTFLTPEPEPKIHAATYGYYFQESRVGEVQFAFVGNRTYQFEGEFSINITMVEVEVSFDGEVGDFGNSAPRFTSFSKNYNYNYSSLPFPTAVDARIFVDVTIETTFLLPPERWGTIHVGYSKQFTLSLSFVDMPTVTVEMTATGKEVVTVPHGTYENAFVLNGTQPDMDLEMTLWVTEQGVVPQAEVTIAAGGVDPLMLTMKLEHYE
jgi:hypothetical protein